MPPNIQEKKPLYIKEYGSPRRCGGQGDILAGIIGTFCSWANSKPKSTNSFIISAVITSSLLVRLCSTQTYFDKGQSMLASDMVINIPVAFKQLLEIE